MVAAGENMAYNQEGSHHDNGGYEGYDEAPGMGEFGGMDHMGGGFSDDEEAVCDPRLQLMLLNNEKLMKSANTDIVKLSREPPSGTPVAFRRTEVSSPREPLLHEVNMYASERRAVNSKAIVTKSPRCSNLQT